MTRLVVVLLQPVAVGRQMLSLIQEGHWRKISLVAEMNSNIIINSKSVTTATKRYSMYVCITIHSYKYSQNILREHASMKASGLLKK